MRVFETKIQNDLKMILKMAMERNEGKENKTNKTLPTCFWPEKAQPASLFPPSPSAQDRASGPFPSLPSLLPGDPAPQVSVIHAPSASPLAEGVGPLNSVIERS